MNIGGIVLSGLLLATVSSAAISQARAEDTVTVQEVRELRAQLKRLEQRLDAQGREQKQIVRAQAAGPVYKGGVPVAAAAPEQPWDKKWHMNGITLTPGGFLAAEGVWRSRTTGGDFSPAFSSMPNYTSPLAHTNEIRGTARQSRISLLAEGQINPTTSVSGYGELDFLGSGITANSNESNSYSPRIRHLYATLDWNDIGVHVLGGQTWSLVTMNNKGITPRNEVVPATIDAQYVAGFTWTRQPQFRLTKDFGNGFWLAGSAEMPQTTGCPSGAASGSGVPGANLPVNAVNGNGVVCNQIPSGGSGQLDSYNYYSLNHVPDFIGKAVWEPTIGDRTIHVEGFGLYTDLYDYVQNGVTTAALSTNNSRYDTSGWGAGGGLIIPVIPKLIDVQGSGMVGRGIGRYGSSQLAGATFNANGSLDPLPEAMFLGGLTVHATPALDLYLYGGQEKILSPEYNTAAGTGYASPTLDNSGCYFVNGTCKGKVHDTWELTAGMWWKAYEGNFGSVRVGLQYAFVQNDLFPGSGASQGQPNGGQGNGSAVHYNNQMVYTSFRYYPFDAPKPVPALVAKY